MKEKDNKGTAFEREMEEYTWGKRIE